MTAQWEYQVRIKLSKAHAEVARKNPHDPSLNPLGDILSKHHATLKSQFDAFVDYVVEAEANGAEHYPLYKWTKAMIEDPFKKAVHVKSFIFYVDGKEAYDLAAADSLEAELLPLLGGGMIEKVSKHDTNPANNPQAPAHHR